MSVKGLLEYIWENPRHEKQYVLPMFVPGAAAFAFTFPMEHVLRKYTPKSEENYTSDGERIVPWYEE